MIVCGTLLVLAIILFLTAIMIKTTPSGFKDENGFHLYQHEYEAQKEANRILNEENAILKKELNKVIDQRNEKIKLLGNVLKGNKFIRLDKSKLGRKIDRKG